MEHIFSYGILVEEATTFTDSDWAGCKSSAGVILFGSHAQQPCTRKEQIIARHGAEAELYAAALGVSELKGIVSFLKDLGYEMKPVLASDAKVTEHILHRQGIGRLTHVAAAYLWMQDEIRSTRLRVRRVKSEGKRCRPRDQTVQQSSDCETLLRTGMRHHG